MLWFHTQENTAVVCIHCSHRTPRLGNHNVPQGSFAAIQFTIEFTLCSVWVCWTVSPLTKCQYMYVYPWKDPGAWEKQITTFIPWNIKPLWAQSDVYSSSKWYHRIIMFCLANESRNLVFYSSVAFHVSFKSKTIKNTPKCYLLCSSKHRTATEGQRWSGSPWALHFGFSRLALGFTKHLSRILVSIIPGSCMILSLLMSTLLFIK